MVIVGQEVRPEEINRRILLFSVSMLFKWKADQQLTHIAICSFADCSDLFFFLIKFCICKTDYVRQAVKLHSTRELIWLIRK